VECNSFIDDYCYTFVFRILDIRSFTVRYHCLSKVSLDLIAASQAGTSHALLGRSTMSLELCAIYWALTGHFCALYTGWQWILTIDMSFHSAVYRYDHLLNINTFFPSLINSIIYSFIVLYTNLFSSIIHCVVHPFIHLFTHWFSYLLIFLFVHSFIHWSMFCCCCLCVQHATRCLIDEGTIPEFYHDKLQLDPAGKPYSLLLGKGSSIEDVQNNRHICIYLSTLAPSV